MIKLSSIFYLNHSISPGHAFQKRFSTELTNMILYDKRVGQICHLYLYQHSEWVVYIADLQCCLNKPLQAHASPALG